MARRERPNLFLLDVVMSGMDGLEVCGRLRAEAARAETPIPLLTVLDDAGLRDRGLALGAPRFGANRSGQCGCSRRS